jgi:UDP-4-amino-4,6-dideoxy-N-acetyl-beta-L-altrosamine transaminase
MIPYGRQQISQDDIDAVVAVLRSDFLTQGPAVPAFEQALADYCGAANAVAVNSATSALHLACLALGVGPGDWVWTSPITFVASANCALYCGARVDFVDIDPRTYCLSPERLEEKLVQAEAAGRLPAAVVAVHLCGQSCDMQRIHALSQRFGFAVVEDASHALGGRYLDAPIGAGHFSDITVFSFHPVKIATTAEGGAAITNDIGLAERMRRLRSHGITREPSEMTHASDGPWYYQQIELGFNYRLTELQAALGLSQLARVDAFVARRHEIARRYDTAFQDVAVTTPWAHPDCRSALHLYVIRLQLGRLRRSHREVFEALRAASIGVNLHYIPVHLQPYYQRLGDVTGTFDEAERYYAEAISLPMFPSMTDAEQERVIDAVRTVCAS